MKIIARILQIVAPNCDNQVNFREDGETFPLNQKNEYFASIHIALWIIKL